MPDGDNRSTVRQLASPRTMQTLEAVRSVTGGGTFDPDVWHVMDDRDNALIEQEILHGAGSSKFVYSFPIKGSSEPVTGISVIGARHLAAHYGGLKHRLVASVQKTGDLFTFTSYPAAGMPMQVSCSVIAELGDEPDFYGSVCEINDIKTGNAIQIERREKRYELDKNGNEYERPHYATIAQSKSYRNAVLSLIPQDVQIAWKREMLKLKKEDVITASVIDQKRANVLQFAAQKAIALDRRAIEGLTFEQIAGLGDAAREGSVPAFVSSAKALGLEIGAAEAVAAEPPAKQVTRGVSDRRPSEEGSQLVEEKSQQQADTPTRTRAQQSGQNRRVNFDLGG